MSPTTAAVKSEPISPSSKRIREPTSSSTPKKRGKSNKGNNIKAEHDSDDETVLGDTPPSSADGQEEPPLSPPIGTESQQARISPRNVAKKNYKDLTDPFLKFNSSHENLFDESKSESEDSAGSDGEFEVQKSASANTLETESLFY